MRRILLASSVALVLLLVGCSIFPSGWRPFGTPLTQEKKVQAKEDAAKNDVLKGAQEDVHKANTALESAPADNRSVQVAKDFTGEAQALLDQANGAPTAGVQTQWHDIVARLLSVDTTIRVKAEAERRSDAERMGGVADRLADAVGAKEKAEAKVRDYAVKNEHLADLVRKAAWILGILAAFWLLGQLLSIGSRFTPALAGASKLINGVVAPAVSFAAHRAEEGLVRVGRGLAEVRQKLPQVAEQVVGLIDAHADADHQAIISKAATEAGGPPP